MKLRTKECRRLFPDPINWPVWVQGVSGGLGAEHFDGIMMQLLMAASWRVKHLEGYCPFNHAPSFQVRRGC